MSELDVPLNLISTTPELFPLEYDKVLAQSGQVIRITSRCAGWSASRASSWRAFAP